MILLIGSINVMLMRVLSVFFMWRQKTNRPKSISDFEKGPSRGNLRKSRGKTILARLLKKVGSTGFCTYLGISIEFSGSDHTPIIITSCLNT